MISYTQQKIAFNVCEDSLTSTVFDLLKYLPDDVFWRILRNSLYHKKIPKESGKILEIKFWEKWNSENTINSKYVEPDLFIRYSDFDVIIEAKRYNESQQYIGQIEKEVISYFNEYIDDEKDLYVIKMGGIWNTIDDENIEKNDRKVIVCKSDWTKLLDEISSEYHKLKTIDFTHIEPYKRIFEDLIKGFEMHGFFKKHWLKDLKRKEIKTENIKNLFSYVRN